MMITKSQFLLMLATAIPFIASTIATFTVFPSGIPDKTFASDSINGILAITGIIFAFQPVIFRPKKVWIYRYIFLAIFLYEGLLLSFTSYNFVTDSLNLSGSFSGNTFYYGTFGLFSTIAFLIYFVFADLIVEMQVEESKSKSLP